MGEFEKFYNKALRFLSYRPRSEKEIRDKLISKKASEKIIKEIIAKLREQKFIDDEEFVKWWIEQRSGLKPQGIRLTELELRKKGIDKELIDRLIHNSEFIIQNDLEQAKRLVEKKLPRYKSLSRQELYQKLSRFLSSKGFDWETIKKAIDPD